jgi:hypothetical protein
MNVVNAKLLDRSRLVGHGAIQVTTNAEGRPVVDTRSVSANGPGGIAYAVAIPAAAVRYDPAGVAFQPAQVDLSVDAARVSGSTIRLETIDPDDGIRALRSWRDAADFVSWEVEIPAAGTWVVEGTLKTRSNTRAVVKLGDEQKTAHIFAKRARRGPARIDLGSFAVPEPGTLPLRIGADESGGSWRPFDIYGVRLRKIQ